MATRKRRRAGPAAGGASRRRRPHPLDFAAWVRRWRLGPGLNDRHPRILDWIGLLDRIGLAAEAAEMRALRAERRYSGFDGCVGPGWLPLLDRLAADLVALGWDRDLHQVKSKFSTLRFYVGRRTRAMARRIRAAEEESERTCEACGQEVAETAGGPAWRCRRCPAGAQRRRAIGRSARFASCGEVAWVGVGNSKVR